MAQKVQIHLEDDLEGGPADQTVSFALDGRDYEIDLSAANTEKLREVLRPYLDAARRSSGRSARGSSTRLLTRSNPDTAKIRAWAQEHGYQVSDRGRIHQHIQDAYYTASN